MKLYVYQSLWNYLHETPVGIEERELWEKYGYTFHLNPDMPA